MIARRDAADSLFDMTTLLDTRCADHGFRLPDLFSDVCGIERRELSRRCALRARREEVCRAQIDASLSGHMQKNSLMSRRDHPARAAAGAGIGEAVNRRQIEA